MNLTNAAASQDSASMRNFFFLAPRAPLEKEEEEEEEADPRGLPKAL